MPTVIPDLNWYISVSDTKKLQPRCPFATVKSCPRFYQSLSLLGGAGSTRIDTEEDKRLQKYWENSDLWPPTLEYATSISGSPGDPHIFSNFCPEVSFDRFGYFASLLGRYADEIDIGIAHKRLELEGASANDWRWGWSAILEMHYTECPIYSILAHRSQKIEVSPTIKKEMDEEPWYKRPIGILIIGIIIAVAGGIILRLLPF